MGGEQWEALRVNRPDTSVKRPAGEKWKGWKRPLERSLSQVTPEVEVALIGRATMSLHPLHLYLSSSFCV